MGLNGIDLCLEVRISLHHIVIGETKVVLLLSGNHKLVIGVSKSIFSLEQLGGEISVSGILPLGLSLEVRFLSKLAIEVSLERLGLNHKSGVIVLSSHELRLGILKSFLSSSELEVLGISQFGEFICFLLSFVQIVINALYSGIIILALSFLESNTVSESINLILILSFLFSELGQFVLKVISVLSQTIDLVGLNGNFSLKSDALLLSSTNLVSDRTDFSLVFIV